MPNLVLASSSRYRQAILSKLRIEFQSISPDIDESAIDGELPEQLVSRLAEKKALAVAEQFPRHLIIGSDQVAIIGDQILTKPGSHAIATRQLKEASGKTVRFLTGLCLYNAVTQTRQTQCVPFHVHFRELSEQQIENYLHAEKPYDCAGSFKSEGYGICLFRKLQGDDPNSLIGLPLIALIDMLRNEGVAVP
ncbi:MAG: nucleoside triphosphate pyrophosphatase, partial [Thiohalomonadales bacterium]